MTVMVWERKKERKKGVEVYDGCWGMMEGIRARGEFDDVVSMSMMLTINDDILLTAAVLYSSSLF